MWPRWVRHACWRRHVPAPAETGVDRQPRGPALQLLTSAGSATPSTPPGRAAAIYTDQQPLLRQSNASGVMMGHGGSATGCLNTEQEQRLCHACCAAMMNSKVNGGPHVADGSFQLAWAVRRLVSWSWPRGLRNTLPWHRLLRCQRCCRIRRRRGSRSAPDGADQMTTGRSLMWRPLCAEVRDQVTRTRRGSPRPRPGSMR